MYMLEKQTAFVESLQQSPNKITKHAHNNTYFTVKMISHADSSNLEIQKSFIEIRRNRSKKSLDSQFEMRVQTIDNSDVLLVKSSYFNGQHIPFATNESMKWIITSLINVMFRGDNQYLYTHDNVKLDPYTQQLFTNLTSNVGLLFLLRKKPILKKQFAEIYQLLDPSMFQEKNLKEKLNFRIKFRAIAIFILSFAQGKRLQLFFENDNFEKQITFQEAKKPVGALFDRYMQLLSKKRIVKRIKEFQNRDKANYALFLKRVFYDQCKGLTWGEVISLLVFRYKSVKPHTNIFLDFAEELYQMEESKQYWEELGLGDPSQRQWYFIAKLGVDISQIIKFQSFEEYIRTEENWNEEKERVCMTVLQFLNKLEQKYKIRSQTKATIEGQEQKNTENEEKSKQESTFTRYSQIYTILKAAIGYYRAKVNQTSIKYMSNEKRILTKFFNL